MVTDLDVKKGAIFGIWIQISKQEEEIAPQIEILASREIREMYINDQPILSIYGVSFAKLFTSIIKIYMGEKEEGKFLFPRMFKLNEGENIIRIKMVNHCIKNEIII